MATWFAHEYCSDISATREFYRNLVGLRLVWDQPDDIAFVHDCVQVSFREVDSIERPSRWGFQPGWSQGQLAEAPDTEHVRSISIALPAAGFRDAVSRLTAAGVVALRPEPFWVGYWSFVVLDPDGRTVELTDPESPEARGESNSSVDAPEFEDRLARLTENLEHVGKLLEDHGDDQWSGWAARCRRRLGAHDAAAFDHILGAFGGMGSFNDLVILARNGHIVDPEDEPAVNERLDRLRMAIWEDATALGRALRPPP